MEACCSSSPSPWAVRSLTDRRHVGRRVVPVKCSSSTWRSAAAHRGVILLAHPLLHGSSFVPIFSPPRRRHHLYQQRKARSMPIKAIFERFTERAVKAVVFAQREARALGKDMAFTQHLLLGLIAEERSPVGFLGSGITIESARAAVRTIWKDSSQSPPSSPPKSGLATDVPFSVSCKSIFEAAEGYSRNMGCNFISPEHIALGLFTADDGSAIQVLKRLRCNSVFPPLLSQFHHCVLSD